MSIKHQIILHKAVYISSHMLCSFVEVFVIYLYIYFRVLLENAGDLIEMQMRNESANPRSSETFYERYHSLNDVCLTAILNGYFFHFKIPQTKSFK